MLNVYNGVSGMSGVVQEEGGRLKEGLMGACLGGTFHYNVTLSHEYNYKKPTFCVRLHFLKPEEPVLPVLREEAITRTLVLLS